MNLIFHMRNLKCVSRVDLEVSFLIYQKMSKKLVDKLHLKIKFTCNLTKVISEKSLYLVENYV